jgi:hypothetical protein
MTEKIAISKTFCAEKFVGFIPPEITFSSDLEGRKFANKAVLEVPRLLYLFYGPRDAGGISHLVVDVWSEFFASHHDWEYEVSLRLDGTILDKRLFHGWYGRHQFLLEIPYFRQKTQQLELHAQPTRVGQATNKEHIAFAVEFHLTSKPRLLAKLEKDAIWLFSTARSGSSWLAMDILCRDERGRPIDEPGLGRMFAPLQWDPERFFGLQSRVYPFENGLSYELGQIRRCHVEPPPFERMFTSLYRENAIFSHHNYDLYHRLIKTCALEHFLNEWGFLDVNRLVFKLPNGSHASDFIMRAFPGSHMVFLMRDGRDVMRSRFSPFSSRLLAEAADPELRRYGIVFYSHLWNFQVDIIRSAFEAHAADKKILVRYEDLRREPARAIRALYDHLGYAASDDEVRSIAEASRLENVPETKRGPDKPVQEGRVGGYRDAFNEDEIAMMNAIMGDNLARYGYLEP